MPTLRERLARLILGPDAFERLSAVSVQIDDAPGWDAHNAQPADRPWADRAQDLDDALEAWRLNFMIRRIVTLTRSYVVGDGIAVSSPDPHVDAFIQAFCRHPQNRLDRRLGPMCDELTRSGELFPILFTNRVDGMSYIRLVPAAQIRAIDAHPEDYETELSFTQLTAAGEPRTWIGPAHPAALSLDNGKLPPVMLHFAVNRPIGATRGEGDLVPILPWARRYAEWLKDRVRLNRQRTRSGLLDVTIADDSQVDLKRRQLATRNPIEHGIYVHGPGETTAMHQLNINANDADRDGQVLRLAIAAGANAALHYLGEGEAVNYSTAKEMGEPTARFYTQRQQELCHILLDIITFAWRRSLVIRGLDPHGPAPNLRLSVPEVARADNESLAKAAQSIVAALAQMRACGWIDDETALTLALKFAGEPLTDDDITRILTHAAAPDPP